MHVAETSATTVRARHRANDLRRPRSGSRALIFLNPLHEAVQVMWLQEGGAPLAQRSDGLGSALLHVGRLTLCRIGRGDAQRTAGREWTSRTS